MRDEQESFRTILVVDDNPENLSLLKAVLAADYTIRTARRGSEALEIAQEILPDLILLDIMMPGMSGYEVCERLKVNPLLRDIPVIFLSILETTEVKVKAFKAGGVDYITKPFQADEVLARVRTHLTIRTLQLRLENQNKVLAKTVAEQTRLAMIVESSNDAIFSVSLDDVITSWNRSAEIIFGYSESEIIGSKIYTIIPGGRYNEKSNILQTILRGEDIQHYETARIRKDGVLIYVSITISPILDPDWKLIGYSIIAGNVTERRKMEETIKHQAFHDILTDLPNRLLFMDLFSLGLAQSRRNKKKLVLMFMDLNNFKKINDTLGHASGDILLQEVARRLKGAIRESDTVARYGGDEFTLLMPDLAHTDDVSIVIQKILTVFETPFMLNNVVVRSGASIGISIFPDDGEGTDELLKNADIAMYKAKGSGRTSFHIHNSETYAHTVEALAAVVT